MTSSPPWPSPGGSATNPTPFGLPSARAAVAADFARRGFPIDASRIVLTASTSEAYAFLFKTLCDPGDEVLVPRPGYPLFDYLAGLESVRPVAYPLEHDGEWHLDLAALRERATARTRAVVVVSPHNPTGAFLKRSELEGLEAFCADRGLALVSDEVFADYAFRDDPRRAGSVAHDGEALALRPGRSLQERRPSPAQAGLDGGHGALSPCAARPWPAWRSWPTPSFPWARPCSARSPPSSRDERRPQRPVAERVAPTFVPCGSACRPAVPPACSSRKAAGTPSSGSLRPFPSRSAWKGSSPSETCWFIRGTSLISRVRPTWC